MTKAEAIHAEISQRLSKVMDPGTGADVMRMRLVEELKVDENGLVEFRFRPSSQLCPMAVSLVMKIREAVFEVEGVTGQEIEVVGYVQAEQLNQMLREL